MPVKRMGISIVATVVLLFCATDATAQAQYRVAGIILTPEKQLAVIENADGSQALYRTGDSLEHYVIELVEKEGVFLTAGTRRIFLELQGRPTLLADVSAVRATSELQVTDSGHATKGVDARQARNALQSIDTNRNRPPTGNSTASSSRDASAGGRGMSSSPSSSARERTTTLAEEVNMAVGLPSYASISKVDRTDVMSAEHAKLLLEDAMLGERTVRLEIGGSVAGVDVIYLTPNGEAPRSDSGG